MSYILHRLSNIIIYIYLAISPFLLNSPCFISGRYPFISALDSSNRMSRCQDTSLPPVQYTFLWLGKVPSNKGLYVKIATSQRCYCRVIGCWEYEAKLKKAMLLVVCPGTVTGSKVTGSTCHALCRQLYRNISAGNASTNLL